MKPASAVAALATGIRSPVNGSRDIRGYAAYGEQSLESTTPGMDVSQSSKCFFRPGGDVMFWIVVRRARRLTAVTLLQITAACGAAEPVRQPTSAPAPAPNRWEATDVPLPRSIQNTALRLSFGVPADFVIGHFAARTELTDKVLNAGVVLVEAGRLGSLDPQKLDPDGLPTVRLYRMSTVRTFVKDEWKCRIGPHDVYKLPGVPGPYGEGGYAYLVRAPVGDDVLIIGSRLCGDRVGSGAGEPTHYDWVIERIIASMTYMKD